MNYNIVIPKIYNCVETFIDIYVNKGHGGRTAIYYKNKKYTYEEVFKNVNKVGNFLKELGLERENRVLLILPDCPELIFFFFWINENSGRSCACKHKTYTFFIYLYA